MKGAYRGLVERLDPFSSYLRPEEVQRIATLEGEADVGLYLVRGASGFVRVVSVRHGSPAWKEGIRPGRWIELIDGRFFTPADDGGAPSVVILNDRFARVLDLEHPVGASIMVRDGASWRTAEVVGVVATVHKFGLTQQALEGGWWGPMVPRSSCHLPHQGVASWTRPKRMW